MLIVGEKINATRRQVAKLVREHDAAALVDLARSQEQAGAGYIDVNVGTDSGSRTDEIADMRWAATTVAAAVTSPLCIDSADPEVLRAGLEAGNGRPPMINSAKAEDENLEQVLSLARGFDTTLVALVMDESGISPTVDGRLKACEKIVDACRRHDVPLDRVYFDPLVLPVSADVGQGLVTLATISEIKRRYPESKTIMGLSNVSYGLPARQRLNSAFLHMAVHAGLDAAIANPMNEELMAAVKTAEVLVGRDRHCRRYVKAFRVPAREVGA